MSLVNLILMYLENQEVLDNSNNESNIALKHKECTIIFIQLPVDPNGIISDTDSGGKAELSLKNLLKTSFLPKFF